MKKALFILTLLFTYTASADIVYERTLNTKEMPVGVVLTWATATEDGNANFYVERSVNGGEYENIGIVKGAGYSTKSQPYNFLDINASSAKISYRLRQVDFDGSFSFSQVSFVEKSQVNELIVAQISTAHTTGNIDVTVDAMSPSKLVCKILNAKNEVVNIQYVNVDFGLQSINFDLTDQPIGTYKINISNQNETEEIVVSRVAEESVRRPVVASAGRVMNRN